MKKRYVVQFTGLFEHGYLQFSWWKKPKQVKLEPGKELDFATKFKFKCIADFCCYSMQNTSTRNYDMRTWSVKEIEIPADQKQVDKFNSETV